MTNLEKLNQSCSVNETAEDKAIGMMIADIVETYEIEMSFNMPDRFIEKYHAMKAWLESEVKE